jgi:hypothetical protein
MSNSPPIACTLSPAALQGRAAEIRALGTDGLLDMTHEGGRATLRFRPDDEIRERLAAIVAAESQCCAFLDLRIERDANATVLTIAAPNGGDEVVHELAAMFRRALSVGTSVFIVGSLAWGVAFDGFRPDRYDLAGAGICLAGVAVIMYAPR